MLEQYILMCVAGVQIPAVLCESVSEMETAPEHLLNYLHLIQGGDPENPDLQKEVVFMLSLDCVENHA